MVGSKPYSTRGCRQRARRRRGVSVRLHSGSSVPNCSAQLHCCASHSIPTGCG